MKAGYCPGSLTHGKRVGRDGVLAWCRIVPHVGRYTPPAEMHYWMEGVRHEIEALEAAVGTRLFHFGKPGYPSDDDEGHRFLTLDRM
jgi:hypothetical protein